MKVQIYTDGGARGNPGPAAWGYLIVGPKGELDRRAGFIGANTNNVAEYTGIIEAFQRARELKVNEVDLFTDSQLACRQLLGEYRVKQPHLKLLFEKVRILATHFNKVTYAHVPRENANIQIADGLVNEALDEQTGGMV